VSLVGFTVEIYHDARLYKRQICLWLLLECSVTGRTCQKTPIKGKRLCGTVAKFQSLLNTLRTGSFKLFKRPFPEFLTILTL